MALLLVWCSTVNAASIRVVPSVTKVKPGESFYVDIIAEDIPTAGLAGVQFRLAASMPGGAVASVEDLNQAGTTAVTLTLPLLNSQSTSSRSGIGDFFWNGKGTNGILMIDNEPLVNGTALVTFGHTNGAVLPSGNGSIARIRVLAGKHSAEGLLSLELRDVILSDGLVTYPLTVNQGAVIDIERLPKPKFTVSQKVTPTNNTTQTIGGTMDSGATVTVNCSTAVVGQVTYPTATIWQAPLSSMGTGVNTINVFATSSDGKAADSVSFTILVDLTAPVVDVFTIPVTVASNIVPITVIAASDDVGVAAYCITNINSADGCSWNPEIPTSTTLSGAGIYTLYAWARDSAGNLSVGKAATVTVALNATLSVTLHGTGSGTVNSIPAGINCSRSSSSGCSATFTSGTLVTLMATTDWKSSFSFWGTACSGAGACNLSMDGDYDVMATFADIKKVKLSGSTPTEFSTLQEAYNAAVSGDLMLANAFTFVEHLDLSRAITITINGGKDASYANTVGTTVIQGSMTVSNGTIVIDNISIW